MADSKPDTSGYSATKAPETRKQAEEKESTHDARLIPGGEHGTPTPQGMAGLDDVAAPDAKIDRP
jgi:hypothetical protein